MYRSLVVLAAGLSLVSNVSAMALPSGSANAVSVLCSALTGASKPAACSPTASPTTTTNTVTATGACANPTSINSDTQGCWDSLDLGDYMAQWWSANQGNCGDTGSDGSASFANCWYDQMTPYTQATCDKIGEDTSTCPKPNFSDFTGDNSAQNYWVTYAIYSSFSFWVNLYQAIYNANSIVSSSVGKVVTAFDPPTPSGTPPWEYVFDALTFGLSLYSEGSVLVKAFLRSLPQSTTLLTKVFPEGEVEGTVTEWADVAAAVGQFCETWANDVASVVGVINNDPANLSALGPNLFGGAWDFSDLTNSLITSVGTYMTSAAAQAASFIITRTEAQSVAALQANNDVTPLNWDTGCDSGTYDSSGICGGLWYYDGTDTYSLVDTQNSQRNISDVYSVFYGSPALADSNVFFTGSLGCSQTCGTNGGCQPANDATTLTPSCLASVRVCTYQWTSDNFATDPFYPDCTAEDIKDFASGSGDDDTGECMPITYLTETITDPSWAGVIGTSGCYFIGGG